MSSTIHEPDDSTLPEARRLGRGILVGTATAVAVGLGGRTIVTRKTTIISRLSPAWYWPPMEQIGVQTEHEYLFEEIKRKIEGARVCQVTH